MIRRITCFLILVLIAGALLLSAEETRIPRRIRFVDPAGNVPSMIPSILYSSLASEVPLVLAGEDESPHNIITLTVGELLTINLEDREGPVDTREYAADIVNDPVAAAAGFDELSIEWSGFLGLVEPDVSAELEIRREKIEAEISLEEQLNTPFQATLWIPIAARQILSTDGENRENPWIWAWPLRGDIAWFFSENLGITGSFRFEYGNQISFGTDANSNSLETTNLMLMPGVGFQVRTLGTLAAEFGITAFFGAVRITADEPLSNPSLNTGESKWVFYPVLSFEPSVVWSPSPKWSVKFRIIEIQLGLSGFGGSEDSAFGVGENTVILNYFQLGGAYRW